MPQEIQRPQALDVQVDVDAAVFVQEEHPHRVRPLNAVLIPVVPGRRPRRQARQCFFFYLKK